jgi:Tfp pilus assembly protein PilO
MRALYSTAASVPMSRVLREHRAALFPVAVILAINLVVLGVVVLPLKRSVSANEQRAAAAGRALQSAGGDFQQAEALREGKTRATADLDTFYKQVLPGGISAARRIFELQLQQLAKTHGVRFRNLSATETEVRDSALNQLTYTMSFTGEWDDVRGFIYELETSPNFVIIDNVVLGEELQSNSLTLSLDLSTYYRSAVRAAAQRTNGR